MKILKIIFYFTDELYIWFSVVTELGFFNTDILFFPNKEPWIADNIIKAYSDLDSMEIPDFFTGGLMPQIHKYYEIFQEYADGKLRVMFPDWVRSPFCVATHLRGMQNILVDILDTPEDVHRLMKFIVECHKSWNAQKSKFLKTPIKTLKLWNDEIDSPTISPEMYKEFILPYELELSEHYGEVAYWHSCGSINDFMPYIAQLKNLRMFHCGPWSSYEKAMTIFPNDVAFDVCLNPQRDVYDAEDDTIRRKLTDIKKACSGRAFAVRADTFMIQNDLNFTINKIKQFNKIAIEVLNAE